MRYLYQILYEHDDFTLTSIIHYATEKRRRCLLIRKLFDTSILPNGAETFLSVPSLAGSSMWQLDATVLFR
jgi:hypothetical protein